MSDDIKKQLSTLKDQFRTAAGKIEETNLPTEKKLKHTASILGTASLLQKDPNATTLAIATNCLTYIQEIIEQNADATVSPVTGLPNSRVLNRDLQSILNRLNRDDREEESTHYALVIIDADGFKNINDTLGHVAGDKALYEIGEMLSNTVRTSESTNVYHWGGDEYAIILRDTKAKNDEEAKENFEKGVNRFRDIFKENIFEDNGREMPLSASMGFHGITKKDFLDKLTSKEIMNRIKDIADKNLYTDKETKLDRLDHIWGIIHGSTTPSQAHDNG